MKIKYCIVLSMLLGSIGAFAQNTFKARILDSETKAPLFGTTAIVKGSSLGAAADTNGIIIIRSVPNGSQTIEFRLIGYEETARIFVFPLPSTDTVEILLIGDADELGEVVISSTRGTRTIKDIPTRIEFIGGDELDEKSNMKTGDIRMLLSESTGIQTQQTSATSSSSSIRIQGLDGRYTQILKDGFPLYSGAANGLGLLQIPPLDLKQVEIIKGSVSTLYGGGAIAGLVNLISKTPEEKPEVRFHLNGTSGRGFDINGYYGQRFGKVGTTIFAAHSRNWAYDPSGNGFTAIPKFSRFTLNPKLYLYFNEKTTLTFGINSTVENRLGGDIAFIRGDVDTVHTFFEENKTQRYSSQFMLERRSGTKGKFVLKNSVSYFNRKIAMPQYSFDGTQFATFSEATYLHTKERVEWIGGVNLWTDNFKERPLDTIPSRNYTLITAGLFIQNTWKTSEWLNIETGFRTDVVNKYGFAFLPRVSALFKITPKLTSRIGGGFGYKAPTIFTEESERIQYRNVLPVGAFNKLEKSYGANIDFNYRTAFFDDRLTLSINQLFFFTQIRNPLLLQLQPDSLFRFVNENGVINTKGFETNIKFGLGDFKLFAGYTFTHTGLVKNGVFTANTLTPKHRINAILMYEIEDKLRLGLEAYYFSPQQLSDGSIGRQYVVCGFMAEKMWERFSIYINFENFLDARQTRFDNIYTGTVSNPVFRNIYAPLEGFLINGGIKIKL